LFDTYSTPNKTFPEFANADEQPAIDPLRAFSDECRGSLDEAVPSAEQVEPYQCLGL